MSGNNSVVAELNTQRDMLTVNTIMISRKPIQIDFDTEPRVINAFISKTRKKLEAQFNGLPNAHEIYDGEIQVTPTNSVQVLNTASKLVNNNITVNPIPSNYGLITWNGATLTVS